MRVALQFWGLRGNLTPVAPVGTVLGGISALFQPLWQVSAWAFRLPNTSFEIEVEVAMPPEFVNASISKISTVEDAIKAIAYAL